MLSQLASQDGLNCTGSSCGKQKRNPATPVTLFLSEGVFIFDLFELCLVLASRSAANFAIPSICCLQNSAPRIFLFQKSECDKIGAHPRWIFKLFLPRSTGPSWVPSDNTEGALERYRPRHCTLFLETGPIIRTKSGYGTIFLAHWPF